MNPSHCQDIARLEHALADIQTQLTRLKAEACAAGTGASSLATGHNPDQLTEAQVGVKEGWRLLTLEEIAHRSATDADVTRDIQMWQGRHGWDSGAQGILQHNGYRTLKPAGHFLPAPAPKPVACDSAASSVAANPMEDVKVGDYLMCLEGWVEPALTKGGVYRIAEVGTPTIRVEKARCWWNRNRFRPATRPEIEAFLLKEAAELGFVVGAKVQDAHAQRAQIMDLKVEFPDDTHVSSQTVATERSKGRPFVSAKIGYSQRTLLSKLTLVKEDPITIVVDGTTYTADFKTPGIVTFGCAKIDHRVLRAALGYLTANTMQPYAGNRSVEAVKVGKGLFTSEVLEKIVARLDAK